MESNNFEVTAKQKGDSLELAIEHIFNIAGFNTSRNIFIAKYEIDVLAKIGDRNIIIECKNYQNGTLTIRNLIHQWSSKNQIIKAHKIIIALAGIKIKESDYYLANELDIELWDQNDISELFNLSLNPGELKFKLINKIELKPISISERYRDNITYLIIKTHLSNYFLSEEELYGNFNNWLRAFILTELQLKDTTSNERVKYIELFEGSKTKKEFFNLITKKRKEKDYWDVVYKQLSTLEILNKKIQDSYLGYMDTLIKEFVNQNTYFNNEEYLIKAKKLISSRLRIALITNEKCMFTSSKITNNVIVNFTDEENININITGITKSESNILNWILTSQCMPVFNQNKEIISFMWVFTSLNDVAEMIYRIFTEYFTINKDYPLIDSEIN